MILMNSADHGLYSCLGRLHLWSKFFALLLEQGGRHAESQHKPNDFVVACYPAHDAWGPFPPKQRSVNQRSRYRLPDQRFSHPETFSMITACLHIPLARILFRTRFRLWRLTELGEATGSGQVQTDSTKRIIRGLFVRAYRLAPGSPEQPTS